MMLLHKIRIKLRLIVGIGAASASFVLLLLLIFQPTPHKPDLEPDQQLTKLLNQAYPGNNFQHKGGGILDSGQDSSSYRNSSSFLANNFWSKSRAVCMGSDPSLGEVEDLFCMPKPDYDPRMKNPCWWENITQTDSPETLSCLPYFHILCCSKSGTTDLYRRISFHPDIVPNFGQFGKEQLYWGWGKYGYRYHSDQGGEPMPFVKYIKGFNILARYLQKAVDQNPKDLKRLVTLDGSPLDMWELRGWSRLPQNRNLRQPAVLTPHLMHHLYRNPKFIVLARDPVERLYTAYLFHRMGHTAADFHSDVIKGISSFDRCLATAQDRIECFINASIINNIRADLHYSCYVVYFKEWLKVFPKKHFLFLRTEEYSKDLKGTLIKIFDFLDLPRPFGKDLQKMAMTPNMYHTQQKDLAGPMYNQTKTLLRMWFKPWNEELAFFMKDEGYLWDAIETSS